VQGFFLKIKMRNKPTWVIRFYSLKDMHRWLSELRTRLPPRCDVVIATSNVA
jgi:hypothetical protein